MAATPFGQPVILSILPDLAAALGGNEFASAFWRTLKRAVVAAWRWPSTQNFSDRSCF